MTFKYRGNFPSENPAEALMTFGAIMRVRARPSQECQRLFGREYDPEAVVPVNLMIDTGAASTCLDEAIMTKLQLLPVRHASVKGVSGIADLRPVFLMSFDIALAEEATDKKKTGIFTTPVRGIPPLGSLFGIQIDGLIGRNFLQFFRFNYSGPAGTWELIESAPADAEKKPTKKRHSRYTGH